MRSSIIFSFLWIELQKIFRDAQVRAAGRVCCAAVRRALALGRGGDSARLAWLPAAEAWRPPCLPSVQAPLPHHHRRQHFNPGQVGWQPPSSAASGAGDPSTCCRPACRRVCCYPLPCQPATAVSPSSRACLPQGCPAVDSDASGCSAALHATCSSWSAVPPAANTQWTPRFPSLSPTVCCRPVPLLCRLAHRGELRAAGHTGHGPRHPVCLPPAPRAHLRVRRPRLGCLIVKARAFQGRTPAPRSAAVRTSACPALQAARMCGLPA